MTPYVASVQRPGLQNRKGVAIILAVFLMFVLFSFLTFSIDVGYLAGARAEIQRCADSAALAGCWELFDQLEGGNTGDEAEQAIRTAASGYAGFNNICQQSPFVSDSVTSQDIEIGFVQSPTSTTIESDSSLPYYAVKVNVARTEQSNGEVPLFFGRIYGDVGKPVVGDATAVMARRIAGFSLPGTSGSTINVLPFALDVDTWNAFTGAAVSGVCNPGPGNGNNSSNSNIQLTDSYSYNLQAYIRAM
ncbi:MAG: hypothetical protein KDB03_07865 [Planctomycetales bacterium]|nr:hypothetical protein [Planctomycetales bacterium]